MIDNIKTAKSIQIPQEHLGYFTFHGEGETDGKRKLKFCSTRSIERITYVKKSIDLYNKFLESFGNHKVSRFILHPDTINRKTSRHSQIEQLALSLSQIVDQISYVLNLEEEMHMAKC